MNLFAKLISMRRVVGLIIIFYPFYAMSQSQGIKNTAFINGLWFNGRTFETREMYCVNGFFSGKKPLRIDTTIDLTNLYMVPPFAETHNHNINGGHPRNKRAIEKYLNDGVFYVKEPGNFFISEAEQNLLGLNRPAGLDVSLAQGASLTTVGGHPYQLAEDVLLKFGYAKGTVDSLNGHRFFTIDNKHDLDMKWPELMKQRPAFIKTTLWACDEHAKRKNNKAFYGQYGIDPLLLPEIVARARFTGLRVTTHVTTAADFHVAVEAGVDEIAHLPYIVSTPIAGEDARLAAQRGIVVITTCGLVLGGRPPSWPSEDIADIQRLQKANISLLLQHNVLLAVGSDSPMDSSVGEAEYLFKLGIIDAATLLNMWTLNGARAIFPERKIGVLKDGYEASFLAFEGNPLEDFSAIKKIKLRFKQGNILETAR